MKHSHIEHQKLGRLDSTPPQLLDRPKSRAHLGLSINVSYNGYLSEKVNKPLKINMYILRVQIFEQFSSARILVEGSDRKDLS